MIFNKHHLIFSTQTTKIQKSFFYYLISKFNFAFLICISTFLLAACGQVDTHRATERETNEANSAAQFRDLEVAEGLFKGQVIMTEDQKKYDAELQLNRVYQNVKPGQTQDPNQVINVPKLSGNLVFPLLKGLSFAKYSKFKTLIRPMGGFALLNFGYGDYAKTSKRVVLPYNVPGYTDGEFGELFGTLKDGVFKGQWFAKPLGVVGKFRLTKVANSPEPAGQP